jgi:hypothetical protein
LERLPGSSADGFQIAAEIGVDMSCFPSAAFCAASEISAAKSSKAGFLVAEAGKTPDSPGNPRLQVDRLDEHTAALRRIDE